MKQKNIATISIVGRPNVGKSTLFNCLSKKKKSIISDIPNTTRDRLIEKINSENFSYWLVDTAGLTDDTGFSLEKEIQGQINLAIQKSDIIIFLVDGKKELTSDDYKIISLLRKSKISIIFAANKIDDGQKKNIFELAKIGFGVPIPVSAKNYYGIWELQDEIEKLLNKLKFESVIVHNKVSDENDPVGTDFEDEQKIKLAFVGRPNTGKSSLFNSLLGKNRSIVSDLAGTTRDTIDTEFYDKEKNGFILLDTAGLKKPGKIDKNIEFWASVRTNRAIERSDICALLLDAEEGVTHQDLAIAGKIIKAKKGLILCMNKIDLLKKEIIAGKKNNFLLNAENFAEIRKKYLYYLSKKIGFIPWAPILFFSAKTGKNIEEVFASAKNIFLERQKRISTSELNQVVNTFFYEHVKPSIKTKVGKIKYVSQVDICPPKFIFFVNKKEAFHFSYRRYLENRLREKYGFFGTPINIEFRDQKKLHY